MAMPFDMVARYAKLYMEIHAQLFTIFKVFGGLANMVAFWKMIVYVV